MITVILLLSFGAAAVSHAQELGDIRQVTGGLQELPPPDKMKELSLEDIENLNAVMGGYLPSEDYPAVNHAPRFYYYEQLDPVEREIYDIIVMIARDPVEENIGIMITDINPDSEEFRNAYMRAMYSVWFDHPEFFWLYWYTERCIIYGSHVDEIMQGAIYQVYFFIDETYTDYEEKTAEFNEAVEKFLSEINTSTSDYEIARQIHDKLIDLAEYNHPVSNFDMNDLAHTAYGALVQDSSGNPNLPVCDGYSLAYEYLLQQCGIEAVVVGGMSGPNEMELGGHAWNLVKIDGAWYEVDSTWDDNMQTTEGVYDQDFLEALLNPDFHEKLSHFLFLLSTDNISYYVPDPETFTYRLNGGGSLPFYRGMASVHIRDSNKNGTDQLNEGTIAMNSVIDSAPVAKYDYAFR